MPKTDGTLKAEVRSLLRYGRGKARTGGAIAKIMGFNNDRLIRHAIRELIAEGVPIASNTASPAGYYIVSSLDEVEAYALTLRKRLIEDAIRRRDFLQASRELLYPGQLDLL